MPDTRLERTRRAYAPDYLVNRDCGDENDVAWCDYCRRVRIVPHVCGDDTWLETRTFSVVEIARWFEKLDA